MAKCRRCPTLLPGRRQLCDSCKADRPGTADVVAARKGRKPKAGPTPERSVAKSFPAGLHKRGQALWSDLGCEEGTAAGALALEICRSADRLDELDRIISGKGVMQLMQFRLEHVDFDADGDQHVTVKVQFQSVLTEARGQQSTFKDLLRQFQSLQATAAPKGGAGPTPAAAAPVASGLDEVSQRRAAREQTTGTA